MDYALAKLYKHLREQELHLAAARTGIADPTFGVLLETGYPEAVVSLLALADGTASLYFRPRHHRGRPTRGPAHR